MTSDQPLPLDDLANALADADFAILFGSAVSNRLTEDSDLAVSRSEDPPKTGRGGHDSTEDSVTVVFDEDVVVAKIVTSPLTST